MTQKDVAERAGVSTSIVSYVINNGPRSVSPQTRRRVLRAVEELGYRPNKHAQMLTSGKERTDAGVREFGIVVSGSASMFTRPFYGEILAGIYAEANLLRMRVRFIQFLEELADPLLFNELIHPEEVSGLILFAADRDYMSVAGAQIVERILARIGNVVCVERKWDDLPAVIFDRAAAAYTAISHLLTLGHRRVGFLGALDDRLTGYRHALFDHGIDFDEQLVCSLSEGNTSRQGYVHITDLLSRPDAPTAVFACSDEVAIGALGRLREEGLRVPDDIAIVGVDDIPYADYLAPRLTTVQVPKMQMGAQVVRMLHDRTTRPGESPISVVLPTTLIVRDSCGAQGSSTLVTPGRRAAVPQPTV
ncbi:MAG: LacI family DNA-binding transcriptional regulator [Caldilineaceae bacterium]